jgi:hypothetical protein
VPRVILKQNYYTSPGSPQRVIVKIFDKNNKEDEKWYKFKTKSESTKFFNEIKANYLSEGYTLMQKTVLTENITNYHIIKTGKLDKQLNKNRTIESIKILKKL